jgi:hypothetical protein
VDPTIAAAWIAGAAALVGAAVGVLGAVFGARFASAKTIEADRHNRVWEKRSEVYTDTVAGILHKEKVRDCEMQRMTTDTAPEPPPAPVDWPWWKRG